VVGGLVLFVGVLTRPLGGLVVRRDRRGAWRLVAVSLIVAALCLGVEGLLALAQRILTPRSMKLAGRA
jgi:nitrate/nitrite transporter NarK